MELITLTEASKITGITEAGLRWMITNGKIDPEKVVKPEHKIRIWADEVERISERPKLVRPKNKKGQFIKIK